MHWPIVGWKAWFEGSRRCSVSRTTLQSAGILESPDLKILHTVIAVVGIAAASGAAWWVQKQRRQQRARLAAGRLRLRGRGFCGGRRPRRRRADPP